MKDKKKKLKKPKYTGRYKDRIKYSPEHAIPAAVLAYAGCNDAEICRHLKMTDFTIRKWRKKYPFFKKALEQGRYLRTLRNTDSMQEWVIGRLTPKAKEVWESIMFWQEHEDEYGKIKQVIGHQTEHIRQRVWLHAFIRCKFSMSAACKLVGVSRQVVDQWRLNGDFKRMVDEILEMQGDFIEEALMDLVAARDTGAVIFASRTKNRDRGYGDRLDINQTVNQNVNIQNSYQLEKLMSMVSVSAVAELSEAMEKLDAQKQLALKGKESASTETIEVEAEEKDSDND
jgi:hypothetical protein